MAVDYIKNLKDIEKIAVDIVRKRKNENIPLKRLKDEVKKRAKKREKSEIRDAIITAAAHELIHINKITPKRLEVCMP